MGPVLFLLFIVVPLLELLVIIQVGQWIGGVPTVLLLLGVSLVGAYLVKREGLRAWRRFRQALAEGRVPTREVFDGALLLLGGALLLTPGFLTDAFGLLMLLPMGRSAARRLLRGRVTLISTASPRGQSRRARPSRGNGEVLDVEVIDIQRDDGSTSRDGV